MRDVANQEKCHGGIPCENCKRTKQPCKTPTKPTTFTPVFVGVMATSKMRSVTTASLTAIPTDFPLLHSPIQKICDRNVPYFFTSFLAMNNLMNDRIPVASDLLGMMKDAPALRAAICAVAAHHRIQQNPTLVSGEDEKDEMFYTLQSYGQSVRYIKDLISSNTFLEDPSALWTTFLLGLFEVGRATKVINHTLDARFNRN
ncbi:hypothetical protein N0V90_008023 [Kalmusia sp. IMI 367209]|nr:hypothetical protein N0V90_008023 [Kalmusia sp. IMI 367209]